MLPLLLSAACLRCGRQRIRMKCRNFCPLCLGKGLPMQDYALPSCGVLSFSSSSSSSLYARWIEVIAKVIVSLWSPKLTEKSDLDLEYVPSIWRSTKDSILSPLLYHLILFISSLHIHTYTYQHSYIHTYIFECVYGLFYSESKFLWVLLFMWNPVQKGPTSAALFISKDIRFWLLTPPPSLPPLSFVEAMLHHRATAASCKVIKSWRVTKTLIPLLHTFTLSHFLCYMW